MKKKIDIQVFQDFLRAKRLGLFKYSIRGY